MGRCRGERKGRLLLAAIAFFIGASKVAFTQNTSQASYSLSLKVPPLQVVPPLRPQLSTLTSVVPPTELAPEVILISPAMEWKLLDFIHRGNGAEVFSALGARLSLDLQHPLSSQEQWDGFRIYSRFKLEQNPRVLLVPEGRGGSGEWRLLYDDLRRRLDLLKARLSFDISKNGRGMLTEEGIDLEFRSPSGGRFDVSTKVVGNKEIMLLWRYSWVRNKAGAPSLNR